jgi:hypothetical protein
MYFHGNVTELAAPSIPLLCSLLLLVRVDTFTPQPVER